MDLSFSNSNFHSKASATNNVGCFPWRKSFLHFWENINIPVGLSIILSSKHGASWKKQLVWDHNSNNSTSAIPPDFFAAEVLSAALPFHCCCCCQVASVVSDYVWPHRWQLTRLPHPWDLPGKNTGVGCHFLLQCMKVKCESEVVSYSSRPHGLQPTRLLHPWDFPGKSTRVGCHCLLWAISLQSIKKPLKKKKSSRAEREWN